MKKVVLLLSLSGFLFASCNKKESSMPSVNQTSSTPKISKREGVGPANPSNPYDYVGELHNRGLAYLDSRNLSKLDEEIEAAVELASSEDRVIDVDTSLINYHLMDHTTAELLRDSKTLSPKGKDFAEQILNAVRDTENLPNIDEAIYSDLKESILSIEEQVMADQSLTSFEQKQLLGMASIGRFSGYYWMNPENQQPHPEAFMIGTTRGWYIIGKDVETYMETCNADAAFIVSCQYAWYSKW